MIFMLCGMTLLVLLHGENLAPVPPAVSTVLKPFHLSEVRLLDGPFKSAMELDGKYILSLDPERLLHTFRLTAGIPSKAEPLGGWEKPGSGLRGHFTGHYLSACALMYQSTGDPRYKENAEKVVAGLDACQKAIGTGYLSAFPATAFDTLESKYGGVWAPYYTIHKIMNGLLDCYETFDDQQALKIVQGMADYFSGRMDKLTPDQIEGVLHTTKQGPQNEFGGMSDVLHRLSSITGRAEDLKLANLFDRPWIVDPMAEGHDTLQGLHANTHIPQAIGWWRHYLTTGEKHYRDAARFFWQEVALKRSYVEGGNSNGEHFFPLGLESKKLGAATAETCNVYNMLKLTRELFLAAPDAELGDYYEKALYNHILGSIDPNDGMTTYFLALGSGLFKVYATPLESFWCCNGTGMENHAKYGDSIYFHDEGSLWVSLYIASELDWKERGIRMRQETTYPQEQGSRFRFHLEKPVKMTMNLRIPGWATNGVSVSINDKPLQVDAKPGSYLPVKRLWQDGDLLGISLPMSLRVHHAEDDPKTVAFYFGPVLLAGEMGRENYPESDHTKGKLDLTKLPVPQVPVLVGVDPDHPSEWMKPVEGKPLTFQTTNAVRPQDLTLSPLYSIHHQRYVVYWQCMTSEEWAALQQKILKQKEELKVEAAPFEARLVDTVIPGDPVGEKVHESKGDKTELGVFNDRGWRDAGDGGWFSYRMKVIPGAPVSLACTFWGGEAGQHEFDILVNDRIVATQKLSGNDPGKFFTVEYPIPTEFSNGLENITVSFRPHVGKIAGGLFALRILKAGTTETQPSTNENKSQSQANP